MLRIYYVIFGVWFCFGCSFSQEGILDDNSYNLFWSDATDQIWTSSRSGWQSYDGCETQHYGLDDPKSGLKGSWIQSPMIRGGNTDLWTSTYEYLCNYNTSEDCFYCNQLAYGIDTLTYGYHVLEYDRGEKSLVIRAENQLFKYSLLTNQLSLIAEYTLSNSFLRIDSNVIVGSPYSNSVGVEFWNTEEDEWKRKFVKFEACGSVLSHAKISQCVFVNDKLFLISGKGIIEFNYRDPCKSTFFNHQDVTNLEYVAVYRSLLIVTSKEHGVLVYDTESGLFTDHLTQEISSSLQLSSNHIEQVFINDDLCYVSYTDADVQLINANNVGLPVLNFEDEIEMISIDGDYASVLLVNSEVYFIDLISMTSRLCPITKSMNVDKVLLNQRSDEMIFSNNYMLYSINLLSNNVQALINQDYRLWSFENFQGRIFLVSDVELSILNKGLMSPIDQVNRVTGKTIRNLKELENGILAIYYGSGNIVLYADEEVSEIINVDHYVNSIAWDYHDSKYLIGTDRGLFEYSQNDKRSYSKAICEIQSERILSLSSNVYYTVVNGETSSYIKIRDKMVRLFEFEDQGNVTLYPYSQDSIMATTKYHLKKYAISDLLQKTPTVLKVLDVKVDSMELSNGGRFNSQSKVLSVKIKSNNVHGLLNADVYYSLDGADFQLCDNPYEISLPSMSAGKHDLTFKAKLNDCSWTDEVSYIFIKNQIWYKTSWFFLLVGGFLIGIVSYVMSRRVYRLEEKIETERTIRDLEKAALQAQMNPHFIFNSLNSIQNFIMSNEKESAMEYLGKFAQLIRGNLQASIESTITLHEEIAMLTNYLQLEQVRMSDKFDFKIIVDDEIDVLSVNIPPMLIQPFVENAVIHGMKGKDSGGKIVVKFGLVHNRIDITIEDNGRQIVPEAITTTHKSYGAKITQKRLAYINKLSLDHFVVTPEYTPSGTRVQISINIQ